MKEIWRTASVQPDWTIKLEDQPVTAHFVKIGLPAEAEYVHLNRVRIDGE